MAAPWLRAAASRVWHIPGRAWAGMIAAAPAKTWLTAGAAMAWTGLSALAVWFFRDKLGTDQAFWLTESALGLVLVALVALTGTEVSFRAGRDGVSGNVGQDGDTVARVTTTTTIDTPFAPSAPAASPDDEDLPPDQRVQR